MFEVNIDSVKDIDGALDHAEVLAIRRSEVNDIVVTVRVPVCKVRTPHMNSNAWKYAFVELDIVFTGARSVKSIRLDTGEPVSLDLDAWSGEDLLGHHFESGFCHMDCLLYRLEFEFDDLVVR